jgi:hypothetical protein
MNGNRCTSDNIRDIDHMFDNSDDLSSDEAVAAVSITEFISLFNFVSLLIIIIFIVTNANTSWLK